MTAGSERSRLDLRSAHGARHVSSAAVVFAVVALTCSACGTKTPRVEGRDAGTAARHAGAARDARVPTRDPRMPAAAPEGTAHGNPSQSTASPGFLGEDDRALRERLRTGTIASVERGRGGRSVGFKITLGDGTVGYFKPEQTFSAAHWYSEVAAYHLDRVLGFGRVPPVVGRRFRWSTLRPYVAGDPRAAEVRPLADGDVRGAFVAWVTGGLSPLRLGRAWERIVRIEGALGRSPYDRPALVREGVGGQSGVVRALPASRAGELSDLLIFDYLVQNVDRWGGDFTNVRVRGEDGPLLFFDNGAGFWPNEQRLPLMEARLRPLQRFRRSTVAALRAFSITAFRDALATDDLAPVLTPRQVEGVDIRVRAAVAHVDSMYARFGEAIWLP